MIHSRMIGTAGMLVWISCFANAQPVSLNWKNQFSGWAAAGFTHPLNYQAGGRYIPDLTVTDSLGSGRLADMEVSFNAYAGAFFSGKDYTNGNAAIKPYRLWLRYSLPRLEIRAGLQKISFGSASILRPLMWFDKIDYRDPLMLTNGVYGLLGRYYFRNNANLWIWGLYGNNEPKGWEIYPTRKRIPEWGGRFQFPVPKGEVAISYHHRNTDLSAIADSLFSGRPDHYPEDRLGIDGKWDLGVGVWFEGVIKHNKVPSDLVGTWETYLNLGMDYTFSLGNGIHAVAEYFRYGSGSDLTGSDRHIQFLALAANYPLGLLNQISAMVYYSPDQASWYRMLSIQRTYDYWSFYLMGYWNPSQVILFSAEQDKNIFAGKGLEFMAVLNF